MSSLFLSLRYDIFHSDLPLFLFRNKSRFDFPAFPFPFPSPLSLPPTLLRLFPTVILLNHANRRARSRIESLRDGFFEVGQFRSITLIPLFFFPSRILLTHQHQLPSSHYAKEIRKGGGGGLTNLARLFQATTFSSLNLSILPNSSTINRSSSSVHPFSTSRSFSCPA